MEQTLTALLDDVRAGRGDVRDDSRTVRPGDVFVAVPGAADDGARHIGAAVRAGAAAVVCRPEAREAAEAAGCPRTVICDQPREALWRLAQARRRTDETPLRILGITGTNGKTTSAALLEHLFRALGHRPGVMGTISYRWPGHEEPAPLTTPGPLAVHANLAAMAGAGADMAIMEVSSHALDQGRADGVPFAGALFTNLTQDHLDYHPDMEDYFRAKARLFADLPRADKAMAVNADDPWGRRLLEMRPDALAWGLNSIPAGRRRLEGRLLSAGTDGCRLRMRLDDGREWELRSPLVGAFNAANLLGVQALALELGVAPDDLAALEGFCGVCGRMERVPNAGGLHVFVDYAHTPDALINVLGTLRGAGFRRIVAVFGCGGDRDRTKRPLMGRAVAEHADVAVLTSDNPRGEDPEAILRDVLPGLEGAGQVVVEADRRTATEKAIGLLGPDDALIIAGKGHEDYQIIRGVKHHYSDQEVVKEILGCA